MEKILVVARDPLVREKLHRALQAGGGRAVTVPGPTVVADYLLSGEFGLVLADGPADWPGGAQFLKWWAGMGRPRFVVTGRGASPPDDIRGALDASASDWRWVDREHLIPLAADIVRELAPEVMGNGVDPAAPGTQHRRASRHERSLRVFLDGPAGGPPGASKSRTVDLSTSGARVVTATPLSPGSALGLRLLLPSISREIALRARVIWSRPAGESGGFQNGLFFDRLDESDRFSLRTYLSRQTV